MSFVKNLLPVVTLAFIAAAPMARAQFAVIDVAAARQAAQQRHKEQERADERGHRIARDAEHLHIAEAAMHHRAAWA